MDKFLTYLFFLSFSVLFAQNELSISQALNIASKQSMLCERLSKEKIYRSTHPESADNSQKVNLYLVQFERNLSILKEANLPSEVTSKITNIEMLWFGYKENILNEGVASHARTVEFNENMSKFCYGIFDSLLAHAKENNLYPYNASVDHLAEAYVSSNKLKFLSQKVCLLYNAYFSQVIPYESEEFIKNIALIDQCVLNISNVSEVSTKVMAKTNTIKNNWYTLRNNFKTAMASNFLDTKEAIQPEFILNQTDQLLKDADYLTRLYKEVSDLN